MELLEMLEESEKMALMKKNSTLFREGTTKKQSFSYNNCLLTHYSISHGIPKAKGLKSSAGAIIQAGKKINSP